MVAEGRLCNDVVSAVQSSHRQESVTTASQTDLSGEVRHSSFHFMPYTLPADCLTVSIKTSVCY